MHLNEGIKGLAWGNQNSSVFCLSLAILMPGIFFYSSKNDKGHISIFI